MPREMWNEGRVLGYSAYEIYVKQHLSEDPNTPPATEREWLASSLAMGTSMLLRVPDVDQGEDDHTYLDIYLPTDSRLAAANTIVAQYFDGDAVFDLATDRNSTKCWATRVSDYGQLLSNTSSSSPSGVKGPTASMPTKTLADWTNEQKARLADYMKIYDGLVIQPGEWVDSPKKPPQKDFRANLSNPYPRVRLHIRGPVTHKPILLLTGFTIRSVLAGVVGADTVVESGSPQDGDFLGPAVFPWAAKITFVVPSSYVTFFASGGYQRTIETPTAEGSRTKKMIKDTAVIDMQASKPETYYLPDHYTEEEAHKYSKSGTNPRYEYSVNKFSTLGDAPTDGEAVLTVYQRSAAFPPALWGTFVGETGEHYLNPLDVVAPGTIKMFYNDDGDLMQEYEDTFPGTTGMNKLPDGTIQIFNENGDLVDVAKLELRYMKNGTNDSGDDVFETPRTTLSGSNRPRIVRIQAGQKSVYALMMSTNVSDDAKTDPTQATVSKIPSNTVQLLDSNSSDNIAWSALLDALRNNRAIDLLGDRLKSAKYTLRKPITGRAAEGTSEADKKDTSKGSAYIEFGPEGSAIRLYIAKEAPDPTNVPIGSIGIGWGFTPET